VLLPICRRPPVDITVIMVKAGHRLIQRSGQPGQALP